MRAACTNCRASHVACSHDLPCARCVSHGLEDSCQFLPRKRRTDFRKKKEEASLRKARRVGSATNATKSESILKEENKQIPSSPPFSFSHRSLPLFEIPVVSSLEQFSSSPPTTSLPTTSPSFSSLSEVEPFSSYNAEIVSASLTQLFGEEYPFPLLDTNTQGNYFASDDINNDLDSSPATWMPYLTQALTEPHIEFLEPQKQVDPSLFFQTDPLSSITPSSTLHTDAKKPPLSFPESSEPSLKPTEPQLESSTGSKVFHMLQQFKQKNERLENLLHQAMNDIKQLKEREAMYKKLVSWEDNSAELVSLSSSKAMGAIPGIALVSIDPTMSRPCQLIQCNRTFQGIVGRSMEELSSNFSCFKLFPPHLIPFLKQKLSTLCSLDGPGEGEIIIARPDGEEVPLKVYSHIIYNSSGEAVFKMFYAFKI